MFAVIKTGGKQFRVAANDLLRVDRLDAKAGEIVTFPVLMLGGDDPVVGAPMVSGATVAAEVVEEGRGPKVIAFKKRRRKHSKRKRGYRDVFTLVRITEILTDGKQPSLAARPKQEPKPKAAAPETDAADEENAPTKAKAKGKAPAKKTAKKPASGKGKKK
jgi:large subunit ribosomal protein L21